VALEETLHDELAGAATRIGNLRFSGSCDWGTLGPMAKLMAFLLALLIGGTAWAQETPPPGVKDLPLVELPADSPLPFLSPRTPEGATRDLERILVYYLDRWNKREVVLIGYSRGADLLKVGQQAPERPRSARPS